MTTNDFSPIAPAGDSATRNEKVRKRHDDGKAHGCGTAALPGCGKRMIPDEPAGVPNKRSEGRHEPGL